MVFEKQSGAVSLFHKFWKRNDKEKLLEGDRLRFIRFLQGRGMMPEKFFELIGHLNEFFYGRHFEIPTSHHPSGGKKATDPIPATSHEVIEMWNEVKSHFKIVTEEDLKTVTVLRTGLFVELFKCNPKDLQEGAAQLFHHESEPEALAAREMKRAFDAYHSLCLQRIQPLPEQVNRLGAIPVVLNYTSAQGGLLKPQQKLVKTLEESGIQWVMPDHKSKRGFMPEHDYETIINPRMCLCHRIFFLFPYFMISPRRTFSGVIPYMRQTLLGLVLPGDDKDLQELCHQNDVKQPQLPDGTLVFKAKNEKGQSRLDDFLRQIVVNTSRIGGELWSLSGYPQLSILEEIILKGEGANFSPANKYILGAHDEKFRHGTFLKDKTVSRLLQGSRFRKKSSIFVFDPAERQEVVKAIGENRRRYQSVLISHGLDIPVGIGYSLNLVPWLIKNQRWLKLMHEAKTLFSRETTDETWETEFGWEFPLPGANSVPVSAPRQGTATAKAA